MLRDFLVDVRSYVSGLLVISYEFDDFPPLVERNIKRVGVEEELAVVLVWLLAHLIHRQAAAQVGAHLEGDADGVPLGGPGQLPHDLVGPVAARVHVHYDLGHVPLELAVHELGPCPEPGHALAVLRLVVANVKKVLVEVALVYHQFVVGERLNRLHVVVWVVEVFLRRGEKSVCFHARKIVTDV